MRTSNRFLSYIDVPNYETLAVPYISQSVIYYASVCALPKLMADNSDYFPERNEYSCSPTNVRTSVATAASEKDYSSLTSFDCITLNFSHCLPIVYLLHRYSLGGKL